MKRFSDVAAGVTAVAKRSSKRAEPAAPEGEEASRDPWACSAYGCPMPGSISESTVGGGPYICRHHFGAAPSRWAEITTRLRRAAANGELIDQAPATSPQVQRMREELSRAPAHFTEPADPGVF